MRLLKCGFGVGFNLKRLTLTVVAVLCFHAAPVFLGALPLYNEPFNYWLDLPERWGTVDTENLADVSFADPHRRAVLQVFAFAGDPGEPGGHAGDELDGDPDDPDGHHGSGKHDGAARPEHPEALADRFERSFQAAGERASFAYQGRDAVLADWSYIAGRIPARGYWLFWSSDETAFAVGAFAPEENYEQYHDTLLSALDSFAPGSQARLAPGPINQFYYPYPPPNRQIHEIPIGPREAEGEVNGRRDQTERAEGPHTLPLPADEGEIEASEVLIEREARVLHAWYAPDQPDGLWRDAWRRFYRAIYRDNYQRLAPLVPELMRYFRRAGVSGDEVPHVLLAWLQEFAYRRVGGDADVQPPLSSLITGSGDCDSLGVVYAALLHHLGYNAILMVSHEYGHAMVGVDIDGAGARFEYDGTAYLVAELTADVSMGQIDRSMADPAGWIGVELRP